MARNVAKQATAQVRASFDSFAGLAFGCRLAAAKQAGKLIVYTALLDDNDRPFGMPLQDDGCEYICFTDNPDLSVEGWRVEALPWPVETDRRLTGRKLKVLSHKLFGADVVSVWLDCSLSSNIPARELVDRYLGDADMAVQTDIPGAAASTPDGVEEWVRQENDDTGAIRSQMDRYRSFGFPCKANHVANGVLLRRHSAEVAGFNDTWWAELKNGSCHEMLSFDFVRWLTGSKINQIIF